MTISPRNDDQVYVAWAVSGKTIPDPLQDSWALLGKPIQYLESQPEEPESEIDYSVDLGESFAHTFKKYIAGYRGSLNPNEQIIVIGLDSATPGRMGIIYYRELLASEFLERLESWHHQFAWPQWHRIEIQNEKEGKKSKKKTIWPVSSPVPRDIAAAAYGDVIKSNKELKKTIIERILPCIIDGQQFPLDIVTATVRRACNRNSFKDDESWKWEINLGIACALYRGYHSRHPDIDQRKEYVMTLEKENCRRDYLYGRLLAIAEKIERIALSVANENRPTTAARLMQRFADRPYTTWRNIELGLQPYMQRLQTKRPGFLVNQKKELDAVMSAFQSSDFTSDKALSGEFLLGYHCQRMAKTGGEDDANQNGGDNNEGDAQ